MARVGEPVLGQGTIPELEWRRMAAEVFPEYKPTDAQYAIGLRFYDTSIPVPGIDLITPDETDRIYITKGSSRTSEILIKSKLGDAVLEQLEDGEIPVNLDGKRQVIQVYDVPIGARALARTLIQEPYRERYMDKLAQRAARLMRGLRMLDRGLFGLSLDMIAVTHPENVEVEEEDPEDPIVEDTIGLVVVPPLTRLRERRPVNVYDITEGQMKRINKRLRTVFEAEYTGS